MSDTAVTPTHETPTLEPHPGVAVPTTPTGAPIEGDAPRLSTGPITAPAPIGTAAPALPDTPAAAPTSAPSPVPPAPDVASMLPTLPEGAPVLPSAAPAAPTSTPTSTPQPPPADGPFTMNPVDLDGIELPTLPTAAAVATPTVVDDTDETPAAEAPAVVGEPEHPMAHLMPKKSKPTEASIRAAEQRAIKKAKAKKIKIGVAVGVLAVSALAGPPALSWLSGAINDAGDTSTETGE